MQKDNQQADLLLEISGTQVNKCMKCGKCSASCPSYEEMDIRPHQFVSHLRAKDIEPLLNSQAIWKCLSCFTCIERCPRGVEPARVVEASRLMVIRQQGDEYVSVEEIPELLDQALPQQLLVSAFRKYRG